MSEEFDDVEKLLRQSFDGQVNDAGFSERVMLALPKHRARSRWLLPACAAAGVVSTCLALRSTAVVHIATSDWMSGQWSGSVIVALAAIVGMSLLGCCWGVSEAEDRR